MQFRFWCESFKHLSSYSVQSPFIDSCLKHFYLTHSQKFRTESLSNLWQISQKNILEAFKIYNDVNDPFGIYHNSKLQIHAVLIYFLHDLQSSFREINIDTGYTSISSYLAHVNLSKIKHQLLRHYLISDCFLRSISQIYCMSLGKP